MDFLDDLELIRRQLRQGRVGAFVEAHSFACKVAEKGAKRVMPHWMYRNDSHDIALIVADEMIRLLEGGKPLRDWDEFRAICYKAGHNRACSLMRIRGREVPLPTDICLVGNCDCSSSGKVDNSEFLRCLLKHFPSLAILVFARELLDSRETLQGLKDRMNRMTREQLCESLGPLNLSPARFEAAWRSMLAGRKWEVGTINNHRHRFRILIREANLDDLGDGK